MSEKQSGLRVPPHNDDAERSILGAMLLDKAAVAKAMELLEGGNYFYRPAHQKIFKAMMQLEENSQPIDQITVIDMLKRNEDLEACGGAFYVTGLADGIPSSANADYYARLVQESSLLRSLIGLSGEISSEAFEASGQVEDLLDKAEAKIFELSEKRFKSQGFKKLKTSLSDAFQLVENYANNPGGLHGVPSGFHQLDALTNGFQNSDLIIFAARPSMGKTAFALSAAVNAAKKGHCIGIFSLEMSDDQLAMRMLCSEAHVDASLVRSGKLATNLWARLSKAAGTLGNANIFLDDTASMSVAEIRAKARRLKSESDVNLIIIDYLQLMSGPKYSESRQQEISMISRSLKMLAKELKIPIIALSQLNRALETRTDKRPMLSDLRESGSIEQDADVVCFIHRPEKFGIEEINGKSTEGMAEIIVAKQRNGPTGTAHVTFIDKFASFENLPNYIPSDDIPPPNTEAQGMPF
jgi:replicative DNA helicase